MARLGPQARKAKSAQKSTLRYIASSDIERTARDFGVSDKTLRSFVNASPEQLSKSRNKGYQRILATDTKSLAKENRVKLVPRLTTEKLYEAKSKTTERKKVRSIHYTESVRERIRRVNVETGKVTYKPADPERVKAARNQIVNDMSDWNVRTAIQAYLDGVITKKEARTIVRKLFKNSGASAARADAMFEKAIQQE